jgi:hypothetical protein
MKLKLEPEQKPYSTWMNKGYIQKLSLFRGMGPSARPDAQVVILLLSTTSKRSSGLIPNCLPLMLNEILYLVEHGR